MNSGAPEGSAGPVPLVASVVLLLNETNMIKYGNRDGHQDGSPATKQMEVQTNIVLRGNRSIYHNTELKLKTFNWTTRTTQTPICRVTLSKNSVIGHE